MISTKAILAGLALYSAAAQAQTADTTDCLHIQGLVVNYASKAPLHNALLFAKLTTGRIKVGITQMGGNFSSNVPCETQALVIERVGYRPQTVLIQSDSLAQKHPQGVALLIPLIAVDKQRIDQTYLQTEQTDYVLQDSTTKSTESAKSSVQHGLFVVTDVIQKKPLQANVCFVYTKTGERKCVDTDPIGRININFEQADIIAIEATATDYQRYEGNLIVESLDGRSSTHAIQLQRELTILSVDAEHATRCALFADNKKYLLTAVPGQTRWFSSYELQPQAYELVVTRPNKAISKQMIQLRSGLNVVSLLSSQPAVAVSDNIEKPIMTGLMERALPLRIDSLPMIYFEQSSYKLRTDSQAVLLQVASYLKAHKNYVLELTGHTDNVGDERLNKSLSEFRAAVAASFLVKQGISEIRFTKAGLGSRSPIAPNDSETNKALNRRVSLKLIATQ
ncbi:OmpA family protein [Nostoc sp. CHAB 5834]|nr:OmpA family protein [Nostoc sp. CHAB 5834]